MEWGWKSIKINKWKVKNVKTTKYLKKGWGTKEYTRKVRKMRNSDLSPKKKEWKWAWESNENSPNIQKINTSCLSHIEILREKIGAWR